MLKAHESLVRASELLEVVSNLKGNLGPSTSSPGAEQSLVELGRVWQAPLYEITLNFHPNDNAREDGGWFYYLKFLPLIFLFWVN